MKINLNATTVSPAALQAQKEAGNAKTGAAPASRDGRQADRLILSSQGRQEAVRNAEPFFKLESAAQSGDLKALMEAAKEKAGTLEINWDAAVDPDGSIYGAAYVEALVTQYQKAADTIETYYAEAHQENLTFDDPYMYIVGKYKFPVSPFFRSDMPEAERDMAFRQERALLWGGNVTLKDPYALKASGGLLDSKEADRTARQAARDKLDGLIRQRQAQNQEML